MTEEEFTAKAAYDLALIAAPIYVENTLKMRKGDALRCAVSEAAALIGAAAEFIKCA